MRTGLTVIGLGFVVARFGLFLRLVAPDRQAAPSNVTSTILGVLFVLLGSAGIATAVVQFVRFKASLRPEDRPRGYWMGGPVLLASLLAVTGVVLAIYLLVRSQLG